jgi:hypothetical protein
MDLQPSVAQAYVLVSEMKVILNISGSTFHPLIRIKIYLSSVVPGQPYHFAISHHVHTPTQTMPYHPSQTCCESEEDAIEKAISTATSYIEAAIQGGHLPDGAWLVKNEDF